MDTLAALIKIPSESGSEAEIATYLSGWLTERGITTYTQAGNVIALVKGADSSKALILNGHIDTVPAGDHDAWTYGPYTPTVKDGVMYGLGTSDMKAGVAGILELLEHYQQSPPPCDIWASFVTCEETDGSGTKSFLAWFHDQGYAANYSTLEGIIAEPTDCTYVGLGHRGNYFLKLNVPGNSSERVESLAAKLTELDADWRERFTHELLGPPTLALTGIQFDATSDAPATLTLDIRTTPELHGVLQTELTAFLERECSDATHSVISDCPVGWCPDNGLVRTIFADKFSRLDQHAMTGSTDLCFFSERDIPCVIYGPGQRDRMHSVNETFVCSKLNEFTAIMREIVRYYGDI